MSLARSQAVGGRISVAKVQSVLVTFGVALPGAKKGCPGGHPIIMMVLPDGNSVLGCGDYIPRIPVAVHVGHFTLEGLGSYCYLAVRADNSDGERRQAECAACLDFHCVAVGECEFLHGCSLLCC
jgi:hypothetical protein